MLECRKYSSERAEMFTQVMRLGEPVVSLRVSLGHVDHQLEVGRAVTNFIYSMGLHLRI